MVRLTVDLVQKALKFINPLNQVEIELRGYKIPQIENLGSTQDLYDVIDLSDNEILKLENFPQLLNLKMLLLSNNKIYKIAEGLGDSLKNLTTLILNNNQIAELSDLANIKSLKTLEIVSFVDNPVQNVDHYRDFVIYILPNLRYLDFQKVKKQERDNATKFFTSPEGINFINQIKEKTKREKEEETKS